MCYPNSIGPVCLIWFVNLNCMRDSKPQHCVQQHKSLKMKPNATNQDKHIKEASKKLLLTIFSKSHANIRKVCFLIGKFVLMSSIYELIITFVFILVKIKNSSVSDWY